MEPFIIFVLIFFVAPAVMKAMKKSAQSTKPSARPRKTPLSQSAASAWNRPAFQDLKQPLQEMSETKQSASSSRSNAEQKAKRKSEYEARQMRSRVAAATRARRLKAHDASHGNTVEGRDIHDKNKNRRADWGARVGPGILNSKTVITAIVMSLVLGYVMANI